MPAQTEACPIGTLLLEWPEELCDVRLRKTAAFVLDLDEDTVSRRADA
jgi:hypothetical protein